MLITFLSYLALQILPAPILTVGILAALRLLTWKRGLAITVCTAIVVAWFRIHHTDFAMACLGNACQGNWELRGYLAIYGVTVVGGLLIASLLIPLALRFTQQGDSGAAPA